MLLKLLLILEKFATKNSCLLLHTDMGLETNNGNISADVNDLVVATRRFTLVLFTFSFGM